MRSSDFPHAKPLTMLLDPDPRGGWRPLIKQGKTLKVYRKLNHERTLKAQIVAIYWRAENELSRSDNCFQPFQSPFLGDFPPLQCMVSAKIHKNSFDVSCLPHPTVWDKRAEKIAEGKLWISVVQDPIMENHHQCTYHSITFFNLSRSWFGRMFGTLELCVVLLESGSIWNSVLNPPDSIAENRWSKKP